MIHIKRRLKPDNRCLIHQASLPTPFCKFFYDSIIRSLYDCLNCVRLCQRNRLSMRYSTLAISSVKRAMINLRNVIPVETFIATLESGSSITNKHEINAHSEQMN